MSIPESQLEVWSHRGAVKTAKQTADSIRTAIDDYPDWPDDVDYEVYLQGSYKNSTNIRGDSDVDVIVELKSTFNYDVSQLTNQEERKFHEAYSKASYSWADFRRDVIRALNKYYGDSVVHPKNKAIKVAGTSNRLPADVVACQQYRKYLSFESVSNAVYLRGIVFFSQSPLRKIVNFPRQHFENGTEKMERTKSRYKAAVRIFKNARNYLIDNGKLSAGSSPSYFVECLIYNASDEAFQDKHQETFCNVVNELCKLLGSSPESIVCQNEIQLLFGSSPEQWSSSDAHQLLKELIDLWNDW